MSSRSNVVDRLKVPEVPFDFEATFHSQYERIARVIARVVRDRARSEELAVDVFLKFWRTPAAHGANAQGWLYRVAVRKGLDELRRRVRRARYEAFWEFGGRQHRNPEEIHAANEEQARVRFVLATLGRRRSELLLLRGSGLTYDELATALRLNPASVGTLLSRAQEAFRKEYVRRYGEE